MANTPNAKVITPIAMISFPALLVPTKVNKSDPNEKAKYKVTLVFPEGADLKEMKEKALAVAIAKFGEKAGEMFKKGKIKSPFRTEDWEDDEKKPNYPKGSVFVNARSDTKPGCVFRHKDPATGKPKVMTDADIAVELYPGSLGRASVVAFAYDHTLGGKGVSFALNHVQKIDEGTRLDSRRSANDEFEALDEEAPASLEDLTDVL